VPILENNGACPAGVDVHLVYSKMRRISSMVENNIFIVASYDNFVSELLIKTEKELGQ
jgi:hypothetical protein